MTAAAAESLPAAVSSVAVTFIRVLVGSGGGWTAVWRLPAMVGVVEISKFGWKMSRKERKTKKITEFAPMVFRTTAGELGTLGLK